MHDQFQYSPPESYDRSGFDRAHAALTALHELAFDLRRETRAEHSIIMTNLDLHDITFAGEPVVPIKVYAIKFVLQNAPTAKVTPEGLLTKFQNIIASTQPRKVVDAFAELNVDTQGNFLVYGELELQYEVD